MSGINEKELNDYPEFVSLKSAKIIINQMKNNIFKIYLNDRIIGTGFFCKIPFINNIKLKVLITNSHIINLQMEKIIISLNNDSEKKEIELNNRIKYTNKEYDITIIEIKEKDKINNYFELDEIIMKKNKNILNNSIYVLQYQRGKNVGVSYGIIKGINKNEKYYFNYLCSIEEGPSGLPIINLENNKVIGIYRKSDNKNNYNMGLLLNYPIEDFINNNNYIL